MNIPDEQIRDIYRSAMKTVHISHSFTTLVGFPVKIWAYMYCGIQEMSELIKHECVLNV